MVVFLSDRADRRDGSAWCDGERFIGKGVRDVAVFTDSFALPALVLDDAGVSIGKGAISVRFIVSFDEVSGKCARASSWTPPFFGGDKGKSHTDPEEEAFARDTPAFFPSGGGESKGKGRVSALDGFVAAEDFAVRHGGDKGVAEVSAVGRAAL